jgi:hypothetical protein
MRDITLGKCTVTAPSFIFKISTSFGFHVGRQERKLFVDCGGKKKIVFANNTWF